MTFEDLLTLRVDQVGSLVISASLRSAFARNASGDLSDDELVGEQNRAIEDVVRKQEEIGFPIVTDGELRRRNFQESFSAAVSGFDVPNNVASLTGWREANNPLHRTEQKFDAAGPAILTRRRAIARLALRKNIILHEYRFLAKLTQSPIKVSLIGPDRIAQRFAWEHSSSIYKDIDEFIADVVAIQRQMISQLVDDGCKYIHMDAPGFTAYIDEVSLARMRARGEDPSRNLERAIQAENDVISGFDNVVFGLHLCRGNIRGVDPATGRIMPQWHREGTYDAIAEQLFSSVKHHRLLLEYDSERAGSFSPLRFVPKGKIAVLGLVTTKSAEVETAEDLTRRIDDAAVRLPLDQLALSPQCGFSSGIQEHQLPADTQWRKLERVLEVSDKVWGRSK